MSNATVQYGAIELSAPLPGTPFLPPLNPIVTSDSFGVPGALIPGEMTDAALGGEPYRWTTTNTLASTPKKEAGTLVFPSITGGSFLPLEHTDIEVSVRVVSLPSLTTSNPALNLRASSNAAAPTNTAYRFGFSTDGRVRIEKRDPTGTSGLVSSGAGAVKPGDVLVGRVIGNRLIAYVNGVEVARYVDNSSTPILRGSFVGPSASELAGAWSIDNFVVRIIDDEASLPAPPASTEWPVVLSDAMSGSGPLHERTLDNLRGGTTSTKWSVDGNSWVVADGKAMVNPEDPTPTVGRSARVFLTHTDIQVDYSVPRLPGPGASASHVIGIRATSTTAPDGYRASLAPNGTVRIYRRIGNGAGTNVALTEPVGIQVGDRLSLRAVGQTISFWVNDVKVSEVVDSAPEAIASGPCITLGRAGSEIADLSWLTIRRPI